MHKLNWISDFFPLCFLKTHSQKRKPRYCVFSLFAATLSVILHNFTELSNPIYYSHRIFQKLSYLCSREQYYKNLFLPKLWKAFGINGMCRVIGERSREWHFAELRNRWCTVRSCTFFFVPLCEQYIIESALRRRPVARPAAGGSRRATFRFGSIHIRPIDNQLSVKPSMFFVMPCAR